MARSAFKMKGMDFGNSPVTQKESEGTTYSRSKNPADKKAHEDRIGLESRPRDKANKLREEIAMIKEDASSSGNPLTDAQKKQIANLEAQIAELEAKIQ